MRCCLKDYYLEYSLAVLHTKTCCEPKQLVTFPPCFIPGLIYQNNTFYLNLAYLQYPASMDGYLYRGNCRTTGKCYTYNKAYVSVTIR